MAQNKDKVIGVRLDATTVKQLRVYGQLTQRSVSQVLRLATMEFIARNGKGK